MAAPLVIAASIGLASGCTLDSTGAGGASSTSVTTSTDMMSSSGNFMPTTATGMLCGDNKVDPGEQCDGGDLANQSCVKQGFSGGQIKCTASCALDVSGCVATCGDGVKQPGEVCDAGNVDGHTCVEKGYVDPSGVTCVACALDFTACKAKCGNSTTEPGEQCDDGNTIDDDTCPSNCLPGSGGTCGSAFPVPIGFGSTMVLSGNAAGGGQHASLDANCAAAGADRVYAITPNANGFLTAWLPRSSASFDALLWISGGCSETADAKPMNCNDTFVQGDAGKSRGGEFVSIPVASGTTYYLYVESKGATGSLPYELDVRLSAGTCADPIPLTFVEGSPQSVVGTNTGTTPTNAPNACLGGSGGGEIMYEVKNPFDQTTHVDLSGNFNVVLYARSACSAMGMELDCSNGALDTDNEAIDYTVPVNTPVYVYVDGGLATAFGDYTMTLVQ